MIAFIIAAYASHFGAQEFLNYLLEGDPGAFNPTVKIMAFEESLNGQPIAFLDGSGTLISEDGLVLTNAHVVVNPDTNRPFDMINVCVSFDLKEEPECRFTATIERYDERIDLALVQINDTPVFGRLPDEFPYLNYTESVDTLELGDRVSVAGYPTSGGITIHYTEGQVSGYEVYNGYTYLKTDADIDSGNSGGTMMNEEGNLIAVPTYINSNYETFGRALIADEFVDWINSNRGEPGVENPRANEALAKEWTRLLSAQEKQKHEYTSYPGLSFELSEEWLIHEIADESFILSKVGDQNSYVNGYLDYDLFEQEDSHENHLKILHGLYGDHYYTNQDTKQVAGKDVVHLWHNTGDGTDNVLYITHGYFNLSMDYFIPNNDNGESEREMEEFLASITFNEPIKNTPPTLEELTGPLLPFKVKTPEGWRLEKEMGHNSSIARAESNPNLISRLIISYWELPQGLTHLTGEEGLQNDFDLYVLEEERVTFQDPNLIIDGLPGWLYASERENDTHEIITLSATILSPMHEIYFFHEVERDQFEQDVAGFLSLLESYQSQVPDLVEMTAEEYVAMDHWPEDSKVQEGVYQLPSAEAIISSLQ